MPGITKVGPPESSDYRKKPGPIRRFVRSWLRFFDMILLASVWRRRPVPGVDDAAVKIILGEEDKRPSHGLPEADLTDEQREAAVERIKREQSIRDARPK